MQILKPIDFRIIVTLLLVGSMLTIFADDAASDPAEALIIDHRHTDITQIPESAIQAAKDTLHIIYGGRSHSRTISRGMGPPGDNYLANFANGGGLGLNLPTNIFAYNSGGAGGALDMTVMSELGLGDANYDLSWYPEWVTQVRGVLENPAYPNTNVVFWAWSYLHYSYTTQRVYDEYLTPMQQLEADYPDVIFVYTTPILRHEPGSTEVTNIKEISQTIRDFCIANNKVFFDWADIESYDPDGVYYEFTHEDGSYYSSAADTTPDGNWAVEWRNAHTQNVDWYLCGSSGYHSDDLIGNLMAYAAWWLYASLAGWDGTNQPPVLASIGNKSVVEEELLEFTISATDPETDPLTYTASNLPSGANFDSGTRTFSWTPGIGQAGSDHNVHFVVTDGEFMDSEDITITVSNVNLPPSGGGGDGGGSGGGATDDARITNFVDVIGESGKLLGDIVAFSLDNNVRVDIPSGTFARNRNNVILTGVRITTLAEPPGESEYMEMIGEAYELTPVGANFDPPITLTFRYHDLDIPEGISEDNLFVARWDEDSQEWIEVESTVDLDANTISVKTDHFSIYTIIAPTRPSRFTFADLSVTPTEANIGENVSISVLVTNTGDLTGNYQVILKIDGVAVATEDVELAGRASQTVTFTTANDVAGTYSANVNGVSGTFTVKTAAPAALPTEPSNWWLISIIAIAVVVAGLASYFWVRERIKAKTTSS